MDDYLIVGHSIILGPSSRMGPAGDALNVSSVQNGLSHSYNGTACVIEKKKQRRKDKVCVAAAVIGKKEERSTLPAKLHREYGRGPADPRINH